MKFVKKSKKILSALIAAAVFASVMAVFPASAGAAVSIRDIDASAEYARASISRLAESDIISGDTNGYFHPLDTIKRSEMVKLIVEALGIDTQNVPDEPTFTDVPKNHWAYKYVEAGYRAGVIKGVSSTVFGAGNPCTREEMATMYVRALGLDTKDMEGQQSYLYTGKMTDKDSISSWAKENVEFMLSTGLMKGVGTDTFGAKLPTQRQQVAVLTDRFITEKDSVDKFAATFKGVMEYPELYNALLENNSRYKGNLEMNIQMGITDDSNDLLTKIAMAAHGAVDADMDKSLMNFDINYEVGMDIGGGGSFLDQKFRVIKLDDHYYVKYSDEDSWEALSEQDMEDMSLPSVTGSENSQELIKYYRYAAITKEENSEYREIKATKYTMVLSPEAMEALMADMPTGQMLELKGETSSALNNLTGKIEVYLNENNQLMYQKIDFTASEWDDTLESNIKVNVMLDAYYSNIGQDVDIQAPVINEAGNQ